MSLALHFTRLDPESGSGKPPLIMAHGLFGQGRNFGSFARKFSEKRSVICVDMRNHGDSPWSPTMTYAAMADDLSALIEKEAGGRATILGHSMGGKAAIALALKRPYFLTACVIADIAPAAYDHSYYREITAMRSLELKAITRRSQADDILKSQIPEAPMRAFLLQNLSIGPDGARWKPNLDVIADTIGSLTGWEEPEGNPNYEGPTLFLRGGDSGYVREEHEDYIQHLFPNAEFQTIHGAGHWLHAEEPKKFTSAVEEFLDAHNV